ncbi:MAG: BlaI/MecI/CopY family transcriptional regulator [Candidatus Shapirobacteria bacterium]
MSCNCNCNSKCGLLGGLEQKIMDVLWSSPSPLKPSQVKTKMASDSAYTTIMTVLKRMSDKELLSRKKIGNVFVYAPITDKKTYACSCLDHLFEHVLQNYGHNAVTSFDKAKQKFKL